MSQVVVVLHSLDSSQHLGEIEGFNGNPLRFQNLFAVTHGVEGGRARADSADPNPAHAVRNAADAAEPGQERRGRAEIEKRQVRPFGPAVRVGVRMRVAVPELHVPSAPVMGKMQVRAAEQKRHGAQKESH